jgi:chromosomal replication initiator protein
MKQQDRPVSAPRSLAESFPADLAPAGGLARSSRGRAAGPPIEDVPVDRVTEGAGHGESHCESQNGDARALEGAPHENGSESAAPAGGDAWRAVRRELLGRIPREQFETWFRRAALDVPTPGQAVLSFQNDFALNWVQQNYRPVLEEAVHKALGSDHRLVLDVDPELSARPAADPREQDAADQGQGSPSRPAHAPRPRANNSSPAKGGASLLRSSDVVLSPRYVFDHFVVGPCNRLAHAAAVGVAERPGSLYNPYFLYGSVGLGKTHLLQSLCHSLLERDPQTRILYLSCETFVNHFIGALENGDLEKFRNKYRNVDVLVVDDIHLLANKERTQEEFFHTFNTIFNAGKQIVLSSDSPPKDIPTLGERLVSRFKWGLVAEIEPPCYETRMAILKRKGKERGQELPDDVASVLAERIDTNIRELEGAVTKLLSYANLCGRPVDVALARECLREVFTSVRGAPTMDDVLRVVTGHFGVKLSELQSRKRTNAIAFPRQIGMYLARKLTRMSLEEIGGYFGGRDHSTVLYGVTKVTGLAEKDAEVQELLTELQASLRRG